MQKISVIIPTVQKKIRVLLKQIAHLVKDSAVSEIIIINNLPYSSIEISNTNKVKVISPKENLYVNKSWNYGISIAENNNFLLLNDDILTIPNFCSLVVNSDIFNSEDTGLIGISNDNIYQFSNVDDLEYPLATEIKSPCFRNMQDRVLCLGDWGVAIFGKRSNWVDIPEDLKIIYGDNYILSQMLIKGKKNYALGNLPINHIHSSSSSSPEFMDIVSQDIENSKKYFK